MSRTDLILEHLSHAAETGEGVRESIAATTPEPPIYGPSQLEAFLLLAICGASAFFVIHALSAFANP